MLVNQVLFLLVILHISSIFSWLRYDQSLNTSRLWREDLGWQTETYKTQRWNNSRLSETSPGSRSSNFSANSFFLFFKQNNFFQKTGSQGVRESAAPLTWSSFFCNLTFAAESIRIDYFVSRSEEIFRFQKSGSLADSNERPAFIKWLFVLFLHSVIRQKSAAAGVGVDVTWPMHATDDDDNDDNDGTVRSLSERRELVSASNPVKYGLLSIQFV